MTTTNPVPSNDPTDLLFNAQKLDQVVNGSAQYYTDRLGVNRRTVEGISAAADVVLGGIGYAPPVAYASGISLTLTTQTVEYAGEVYAPKVANLPFTTSTWATDSAKFRLIQGVAATDLAASGGSSMIGYMPAGTGAVATTVQATLRRSVNVLDFMTNAERADVFSGNSALDHTTSVAKAFAHTSGDLTEQGSVLEVVFPAGGTYRFGGITIAKRTIVKAHGATFRGRSTDSFILKIDAPLATENGMSGYPTNRSELHGFRLDMTDMPNTNSTYGIWLARGWGHTLSHLEGMIGCPVTSNKWAFAVTAGCYTTTWTNVAMFRMRMIGNSAEDSVTTQTFIGCAAEHILMRYCANINFSGLTLQNDGVCFDIADIRGLTTVGGDIELRDGTGVYLSCGANVSELTSINNTFVKINGGGTYIQGTAYPAVLMDFLDDASSFKLNLWKYYTLLLEGVQKMSATKTNVHFGVEGGIGPSGNAPFSVSSAADPALIPAIAEFFSKYTNSSLQIKTGANNSTMLRAVEHSTGNLRYLGIEGLYNAVNDAGAAAVGVPVNGLYRNGSVVQIRVV